MMHRYFLIHPLYEDPDVFCDFVVGSGRVRANIQIYADEEMLARAAWALKQTELKTVQSKLLTSCDSSIYESAVTSFEIFVGSKKKNFKIVTFNILQDYLEDGAPFRSQIRFEVENDSAIELSNELSSWLEKRNFILEWKP